jgi:hypothetical protein
MALSLNDVIQVSYRGSLFGQRILNIFHYVVAVAGAGTDFDQLDNLSSNIALGAGSTDMKSIFLAALAPEYTLEQIRVQRVYPTRSIYAYTTDGTSGTYATGCETSNVSVSLEKRTLRAGRMGIGRTQLAGIPTAAMNNGEVTAGYMTTELIGLATAMLWTITTTGPVVTYAPCLFNPLAVGDKFATLLSVIPQTSLRVMRRRTLRVGE